MSDKESVVSLKKFQLCELKDGEPKPAGMLLRRVEIFLDFPRFIHHSQKQPALFYPELKQITKIGADNLVIWSLLLLVGDYRLRGNDGWGYW